MKRRRTALRIQALTLAGSLFAQLASADPLPNAWNISDQNDLNDTPTNSFSYSNVLTSVQRQAATNLGFRFTVNSRMVTTFGSTNNTMVMGYGMGGKRFLLNFTMTSSNDLRVDLEGEANHVLTTGGTAPRNQRH